MIKVGYANDAGNTGLCRPPPRVTSQREAAGCSAMVRAVPCGNLVAAGEEPGDADRVLVCLGAAVCEEESVDVSRCDLRELHAEACAHFSGHERVGIGEGRGLLFDSANHPLVAVP